MSIVSSQMPHPVNCFCSSLRIRSRTVVLWKSTQLRLELAIWSLTMDSHKVRMLSAESPPWMYLQHLKGPSSCLYTVQMAKPEIQIPCISLVMLFAQKFIVFITLGKRTTVWLLDTLVFSPIPALIITPFSIMIIHSLGQLSSQPTPTQTKARTTRRRGVRVQRARLGKRARSKMARRRTVRLKEIQVSLLNISNYYMQERIAPPKIKAPSNRYRFEEAMLVNGMPRLVQRLQSFKLCETSRTQPLEVKNMQRLLDVFREWHLQICPKYQFSYFLDRCKCFYKPNKKVSQTCLLMRKIRREHVNPTSRHIQHPPLQVQPPEVQEQPPAENMAQGVREEAFEARKMKQDCQRKGLESMLEEQEEQDFNEGAEDGPGNKVFEG